MSKFVIPRRKIISISCISAISLLLISYFVDSAPHPIGGEVVAAQWIERFKKIAKLGNRNIPDSICLINVAYDKTLVEYDADLYANDSITPKLPAGKITVTDRKKLYDFLTIADSLNCYKYIMLDVRFEDDIKNDSITEALFNLIGKMDNVVLAMHEKSNLAPNAPLHKAAYGDYHTTFLVTDVVKYPLLKRKNITSDFKTSIPAKMYSDLNGGSFTTFGPFTFYDGKLCRRSIYPTLPIQLSSWAIWSEQTQTAVFQYYNLGKDILNRANKHDDIYSKINKRIVVVGDFVEDIHDTYIGLQPGAIINLNSYISLCRGAHFVNWVGTFFLFVLYFLITWCIIRKISFLNRFRFFKIHKHRVLRFVVSFIGYSMILTMLSCFIYLAFGAIFSIALPSMYFTILESCLRKR